MNTLHVRSVPEDIYQRLQRLAKDRDRSLSALVVDLLGQALETEEFRKQQKSILNAIRRRRFSPPQSAPASLDLLRQDRER